MSLVKGILVRGHGVASGTSTVDRRFPEGTIRSQLPFFKERGLDLDKFFNGNFIAGTLNLSLVPHVYQVVRPEYVFVGIRWTHLFPPENFFLSPARVFFRNAPYRAMLYIPDPATKPGHFQPSGVIEVLAEPVADVQPGDVLELEYNPEALKIVTAD